jgi:hypothetical protein
MTLNGPLTLTEETDCLSITREANQTFNYF